MKKCMTVPEVSKEFGISERHVYNLIKAGLLDAYDISLSGCRGFHSIRISIHSIDQFRKQRKINPESFYAPSE